MPRSRRSSGCSASTRLCPNSFEPLVPLDALKKEWLSRHLRVSGRFRILVVARIPLLDFLQFGSLSDPQLGVAEILRFGGVYAEPARQAFDSVHETLLGWWTAISGETAGNARFGDPVRPSGEPFEPGVILALRVAFAFG